MMIACRTIYGQINGQHISHFAQSISSNQRYRVRHLLDIKNVMEKKFRDMRRNILISCSVNYTYENLLKFWLFELVISKRFLSVCTWEDTYHQFYAIKWIAYSLLQYNTIQLKIFDMTQWNPYCWILDANKIQSMNLTLNEQKLAPQHFPNFFVYSLREMQNLLSALKNSASHTTVDCFSCKQCP